jgi:hypothetical protein
MQIKSEKYDEINFYYNKKPSKQMFEMTKYCLETNEINNSDFEMIKSGNQREIYRVIVDSESYYFKRYSYRSFNKKIKNIFRSSAAYRSFKTSDQLIANQIPVVEPILAAKYNHSPMITDSIFITKDFGGTDLQDFLAKKDYSLAVKEEIIIELAQVWAKLYKNNYLNGDPNLPGILINYNENESLNLSLVDVDNFKKVIYLTKDRIIRNLAKFNAHSYSGLAKMVGKKLTKEDRKLFLNHFIKNYKDLTQIDLCQAVKTETFNILEAWDKSELINSKRCNY